MKLRNLMKSPLSFNLSDGTPIHLASREEMTGLDEKLKDDPQIVRRRNRGYVRTKPEAAKKSSPKAGPKSTPKGSRKAASRGESQGATARVQDGEEGTSD